MTQANFYKSAKKVKETNTFKSIYTTKDGRVVLTFCLEYGWPNKTVGGETMYDNTFFKTYKEARTFLLRDSHLGVKFAFRDATQALTQTMKSLRVLSVAIYEYIFARIIRKSNNFI